MQHLLSVKSYMLTLYEKPIKYYCVFMQSTLQSIKKLIALLICISPLNMLLLQQLHECELFGI